MTSQLTITTVKWKVENLPDHQKGSSLQAGPKLNAVCSDFLSWAFVALISGTDVNELHSISSNQHIEEIYEPFLPIMQKGQPIFTLSLNNFPEVWQNHPEVWHIFYGKEVFIRIVAYLRCCYKIILALQLSTGNTYSYLQFLGLAKATVSVVQWPIFRLIFVDSKYYCFGVEFRLLDASPCSLGLWSSIRRAWQNKQPPHEELGSQCFLYSKSALSF